MYLKFTCRLYEFTKHLIPAPNVEGFFKININVKRSVGK